jgi:peptidoglycan-associated lipoprotein
MNKRWVTIGAALILSGCGSEEVKQSKFDLEQRRQIEQENAVREARVRQEQDELARMREQDRKRDQAAQRAAQTEVPMILPIQTDDLQEKPFPNPTGTLEDPDSLLTARTIYYDYDAYNVREDYKSLVESHAKSLLSHKGVNLRIEGNCDERGSREYNLALGQRRADSVKRALTLLGVPADQIQTVSYGSEKPKATSHDEQAYAENRRSDLIYPESKSASR